jgi:hypothetical protein
MYIEGKGRQVLVHLSQQIFDQAFFRRIATERYMDSTDDTDNVLEHSDTYTHSIRLATTRPSQHPQPSTA